MVLLSSVVLVLCQARAQYTGIDSPFIINEGPGALPLAGATLDNLSNMNDPLVALQGAAYVQGSVTDQYLAPNFGSAGQPAAFGQGSYTGPIQTQYISVYGGTTATLTFNTPQNYFGLLWGSVDAYNSLSFYNANGGLIGTVSGSTIASVAGHPTGFNSGVDEYVNVDVSAPFTKVVLSSGQNSFEFADVAHKFVPSAPGAPAPPMTACLAFAGVLLLQSLRRKNAAR